MDCNKISNLCVSPILSTCVDYEGELGNSTKITENCVNQNDVNKDLYEIVDELTEKTDVSGLTSECMVIPENSTSAEIITIYEEKICELSEKVSDLENISYADIDITNFGLTYPTCIADSCDNPPTTLGEWMQVMMDQRNCQ